MTWSDHLNFAVALFALLNPFTKIPFVVATGLNDGERAAIILAMSSTVTAIFVLLLAHIAGERILEVLGTSLPSFQIGGGIVILLNGLHMLSDEGVESAMTARPEKINDIRYIQIGVSPLGMPMLAGSAAITKVILETHLDNPNDIHIPGYIVIVSVAAGIIIASSSLLMRALGKNFISIVARIAGLMIVAVGVELIVRGVQTHVRLLG